MNIFCPRCQRRWYTGDRCPSCGAMLLGPSEHELRERRIRTSAAAAWRIDCEVQIVREVWPEATEARCQEIMGYIGRGWGDHDELLKRLWEMRRRGMKSKKPKSSNPSPLKVISAAQQKPNLTTRVIPVG